MEKSYAQGAPFGKTKQYNVACCAETMYFRVLTLLTLLERFNTRSRLQGYALVGEPTRVSSWTVGRVLHGHSTIVWRCQSGAPKTSNFVLLSKTSFHDANTAMGALPCRPKGPNPS